MDFLNKIFQWIEENPGKTAGALAGFVLGILILCFGLVKTIFIILLVVIGFAIGKLRDENISVSDQIKRLIRRNKE
jgi:uncharacterized membrane protein